MSTSLNGIICAVGKNKLGDGTERWSATNTCCPARHNADGGAQSAHLPLRDHPVCAPQALVGVTASGPRLSNHERGVTNASTYEKWCERKARFSQNELVEGQDARLKKWILCGCVPGRTSECERVAARAREAAHEIPEPPGVGDRYHKQGGLRLAVREVLLVLAISSKNRSQAAIHCANTTSKRRNRMFEQQT